MNNLEDLYKIRMKQALMTEVLAERDYLEHIKETVKRCKK